jgi:hypothetical protein|tara:strand:- start:360 stop:569 length:210 start_codon:yes stop_codon:yes gene_type:complete
MLLKENLADGETYDTLIRRLLLSASRTRSLLRIEDFTEQEQNWIRNENDLPDEIEQAMKVVKSYIATPR